MVLVYRSHFTSLVTNLQQQAAEEFSRWVRSKGLTASAASLLQGETAEVVAADGTRRIARGVAASYTEPKSHRGLRAAALRLEERSPDGAVWTTSLTVAMPVVAEQLSLLPEQRQEPEGLFDVGRDAAAWPEQPWVWLDLEHAPTDGAPLRPGSPRLVRELLATVEGIDGSLPLTSDVLDVTEGHVDELLRWLFNPVRRVPVIVFSPNSPDPDAQRRFAVRLARDVAGVAVVVRLVDSDAGAAFTSRIGTHLHVYGGAMRTYLPGLQRMEPFPKRHQVLSAASMRALGPRAANLVRDQVLLLSTRRTPPPSYPLVQRILARQSVQQGLTRPERAAPVRRPHQPTLLNVETPELTLPGLGEVLDFAEGRVAPATSREANLLLRATLSESGIDVASVPATTDDSDTAALDAERVALRELLIGFVRSTQSEPLAPAVDAELSAKLADLEDWNRYQSEEIDVLNGRLREYERSSADIQALREEREFADLELTEATRDAERLLARVRWLETELAKVGRRVAGEQTPEEAIPPAPSSVAEAIEQVQAHLGHVEIGDTAAAAAALDVHPQAERWAIKIWDALIALDAYAEAKARGEWSNSFRAWCQETPPGRRAIPATWVALKESETTETTPRLRDARTFAVPLAVDPTGRVYMAAHVKIQQGGVPCPRLHFHDDTGASQTGKVYVGYIGDHLPTANFT